MKRFVKTIVFFFLPVLFGLVALECAMRRIPNDYAYKNNWLTENISHVRIWTFGSSHGLFGISPKYFSKPAFNSAHVSQPLASHLIFYAHKQNGRWRGMVENKELLYIL